MNSFRGWGYADQPKHRGRAGTAKGQQVRCPCCGQETKAGLLVDLQTNTVASGDKLVRMNPTLAEFVYSLSSRYPRTVDYETIGWDLYAHNAPEGETLRVRLAMWASLGRKLGLDIKNVRHRGYRLNAVATH
jgi:hypothetical protein